MLTLSTRCRLQQGFHIDLNKKDFCLIMRKLRLAPRRLNLKCPTSKVGSIMQERGSSITRKRSSLTRTEISWLSSLRSRHHCVGSSISPTKSDCGRLSAQQMYVPLGSPSTTVHPLMIGDRLTNASTRIRTTSDSRPRFTIRNLSLTNQ